MVRDRLIEGKEEKENNYWKRKKGGEGVRKRSKIEENEREREREKKKRGKCIITLYDKIARCTFDPYFWQVIPGRKYD